MIEHMLRLFLIVCSKIDHVFGLFFHVCAIRQKTFIMMLVVVFSWDGFSQWYSMCKKYSMCKNCKKLSA